MDVLIRTLPLHNANYGGILQNWALQYALRELGVNPVTDISTRPQKPAKELVKATLRSARHALLPAGWQLTAGEKKRVASQKILEFVDSEIASTKLFRAWSRKPIASEMNRFGTFITGSDQVWRAKYGDVGSYLFDFLDAQDSRTRIAYAGSFGSGPEQVAAQVSLERVRDYLSLFTAVSCREASGTAWVSGVGLKAVTMPDPTILPPLEAFDELISRSPESIATPERKYLFAYVLDQEPHTLTELQRLASSHDLELVVAGSNVVDKFGRRIGVEQWIAMFRDAAAVVTDSFHGMVFSSRYGTPFAAIPNSARGTERFTSFASTYGLSDRLVSSVEEASACLREPLPTQLPARFAQARTTGLEFLSHALGLSTVVSN